MVEQLLNHNHIQAVPNKFVTLSVPKHSLHAAISTIIINTESCGIKSEQGE